MENEPKCSKGRETHHYSRNIDDTYIFDADAGIYKPKTIETEQERARKQAGTNRRARFFTDLRTDWRPIIISAFLSVGTIALLAVTVYYAHLQWGEMKRAATAAEGANTIAHESLATVQRGFVFMEGADAEVVHPTPNTPAVIFSFRWANSGTTPAILFTSHLNYDLRPKPMGKSFSFEDSWEPGIAHVTTEGFIGPKANLRMPLNWPIDIPTIMALARHERHLYVWGWAKYHDVFAKTPGHITKFCVEVTPVDFHIESGVSKFSESLTACSVGHYNCVDEQCRP